MMTTLQVISLCFILLLGSCRASEVGNKKDGGTIGSDPELNLIVVSTLDGRLRALDMHSGKEIWETQEAPVIRAPNTLTHGFTFLPNPQDGSLYSLKEGVLRKLPFNIPQVVASSPCKGNDDVMYVGSKKDVWIGIDPTTGQKVETLSSATIHRVCPVNRQNTVFVGRREYRLSMFDSSNHTRTWNTTFIDYSAHLQPADSQYSLRHLVSSSTGDILAIHEKSGSLLWQTDVGQPVVAMYLLRRDGLHRLPYTPVGRETMEGIVEKSFADSSVWSEILSASHSSSAKMKYFLTLLVGESVNGLFASNAYVDEKTITVAPRYLGPPLRIEGPTPIAVSSNEDEVVNPPRRPIVHIDPHSITHKTTDGGEYLILGYHEPPLVDLKAVIPSWNIHPLYPHQPQTPFIEYVSSKDDDPTKLISTTEQPPVILPEDDTFLHLLLQLYRKHPQVVLTACVTVVVLLVATVWMCGRQMGAAEARSAQTSRVSFDVDGSGRRMIEVDEGGNRGGGHSRDSTKRGRTALTGWIQVGKVHYDASDVLGTGCQGTVVYRGKFDGREVAVKRVLTEFLPLVDREVELLRESDSHAHVIRYFCMESDSQFRYLALELCVASLYDYVEKRKDICDQIDITSEEILRQATDGLAHLHAINIVHRDLKPQNVLISISGRRKARALISDFGLCKRLHPGRFSLSKRSGIAGTDGWIAPEALKAQSTSFPMDIFSLGCIFYYVLTEGYHPFGESLHRTSNILNGFYSLTHLPNDSSSLSSHLIDQMLLSSPSRRPSAISVLTHPFFWNRERQLAFFSDVSDRVEKETEISPILRRLEKNGFSVVKKNWRERICDALREDLRKFRTYKAHSVRDLLRAMRNKKHHYRELPEDVRASLGEVPHEFVFYFTSRFPQLLMHVYEAMEWCAEEAIFVGYYSDETRDRIRDVRAETEKRMAEESSDSDVWLRGRSSVSSMDGQPSPVPERRRLELLPRSVPIPDSVDESRDSAHNEQTTPINNTPSTPIKDDEPSTLIPRSELVTVVEAVKDTIVLVDGPPPGLEDIVPIVDGSTVSSLTVDGIDETTMENDTVVVIKKKKNRKKKN